MAMRDVISLIYLLEEVGEKLDIKFPTPKVFANVFEDNESCIAMATERKFNPRTKHIAIKYHNFRKFVKNGTIILNSINTKEQTADILTKPLEAKSFIYLRHKLCGW